MSFPTNPFNQQFFHPLLYTLLIIPSYLPYLPVTTVLYNPNQRTVINVLMSIWRKVLLVTVLLYSISVSMDESTHGMFIKYADGMILRHIVDTLGKRIRIPKDLKRLK